MVHDAENFYTKHSFSPEVLKALRFLDDNTKTVLTLNKVRTNVSQCNSGQVLIHTHCDKYILQLFLLSVNNVLIFTNSPSDNFQVDLVKDKKELLTLTATLTKAPYLLSKRQKQRENLNKLFDCYEKLGGMMLEKPPELQHSVSPGLILYAWRSNI